jgi:polyphosphate kinase
LLKRLLKAVWLQQEEFGDIFRTSIQKDLARQGIFLVRKDTLSETQKQYVRTLFREDLQPLLSPVFLNEDKQPPFLHNRALYLVVHLRRKVAETKKEGEQYALVEIPSTLKPRFYLLPQEGNRYHIMFLDDVIRWCLDDRFPHHTVHGAYAIKLTRDAELELGDEFSGDLLEKVKKALKKRSEGPPSRFLYDTEMPARLLRFLVRHFQLSDEDLVPGGRYHNLHDLMTLPNPLAPALTYEPMAPLHVWNEDSDIFERIRHGDVLLHYPYHAFDAVLAFLRAAAADPSVRSIRITLYRVARNSKVVAALLDAARRGKEVFVFVEVKARFDEESNIFWAEELEKAGVHVQYSFPNIKVHAKLCLIERVENGIPRLYAYLSTGNFNEQAACVYTDFGFFTADERLTAEVRRIFAILSREKNRGHFDHLLVAPFTLRQTLERSIAREAKHARKGRDAYIMAKINSLEDPGIIRQLYAASCDGVKIRLIVRGICCLIPGIKGMSENIEVISIVDRFLEHGRAFVFGNNGNPLVYLSSADWMRRNLDRRIEAAFPIYDDTLCAKVLSILELQWKDNVKARIINKKLDNRIRTMDRQPARRSQYAIYDFWRSQPAPGSLRLHHSSSRR